MQGNDLKSHKNDGTATTTTNNNNNNNTHVLDGGDSTTTTEKYNKKPTDMPAGKNTPSGKTKRTKGIKYTHVLCVALAQHNIY